MGGVPTQKEKKLELRDGSVGQMILLKAWEPEFDPQHTHINPVIPAETGRGVTGLSV